MLILDLLNILFDQCDYRSLVSLCLLNKRKTKYANKYSLLIHYHIFGKTQTKNMEQVCDRGELKAAKHISNRCVYMLDAIATSAECGYLEMLKHLITTCFYYDYSHLRMHTNNALVMASKHGNHDVIKFLTLINENPKGVSMMYWVYLDYEERSRFA